MKKRYLLLYVILISSASFGQIWTEDFNSYSENTGIEGDGSGGITNIDDYPGGVAKWTLDASNGNIFNASDWAKTVGGVMDFRDTDGASGVTWLSESIDISAAGTVTFELTASNNGGGFETSDFYNVYYSIDGGVFTLIADWNGLGDATNTILGEKNGADWASVETITQSGLSGNSLQIRVDARNSASAEQFFLDDVIVSADAVLPTITVSGNIPDLDYPFGYGPSVEESFTASGTNLIEDITIDAPMNFEISTTYDSGFESSVTLTQSGGNVASTPIYVRLAAGLPINAYQGDVTLSSNGATTKTLQVHGEVYSETNQCFDLSGGGALFELVTVTTNSDMDGWTMSSGTYSMNGYCGGGCVENVDTWLVFGPINVSGVPDLALEFDAAESFGNTNLLVQYTNAYAGCPDSTPWTTVATITESDEGAVSVDLFEVSGANIFIGIQYVDDGTDGYSNWDLSNVELVSTGACPILGTRPTSDCATCDLTLESENYVCNTNTSGADNDSVTIEVPYTGYDNTLVSVTTTSGGTIAGDNPVITPDGTIQITGLNEGDAWDLTLNGGDCDGTTISGTILSNNCDPVICAPVGSIILTEIMQNPNTIADRDGEYFEVYNTTDAAINMIGWVISDISNTSENFTITSSVIVPANGYAVFGRNGDTTANGGITLDYDYDDFILGNGSDEISIQCSGTVIDEVSWDNGATFPDPNGSSMELSTATYNSTDNDLGINWGAAVSAYDPNNNGTPGAVNDFVLSVDNFETTSFSIYPNPSINGVVTITSTNDAEMNVQVFDLLGKQIKNETLTNNTLNVSNLKTGIYIVRITQNNASITKKLMVK